MRKALRNPHETDPNFQPNRSVATVVSSPVNTSPPQGFHSPTEKKSNTPHLVYAIAGLLAVVIIVGSLVWINSRAQVTSLNDSQNQNRTSVNSRIPSVQPTPSKPTRGSFQVYATSPVGTPFISPFDKSASIHFSTSGQWTFFEGAGFHSAAGHPKYPRADPSYPLPFTTAGSLVVRRGNGNCEFVGEDRTINVAPNEQMMFLINDEVGQENGVGFEDNKGSLTVSWACQNCN